MKKDSSLAWLAGLTNGGVAVAVSHIPVLACRRGPDGRYGGFATMMVMLIYLKLMGQPSSIVPI